MKRKAFIRSLAIASAGAASLSLRQLYGLLNEAPASHLMPALFIGHGSPMNAIEDNPFTQHLKQLGAQFTGDCTPKAFLVVSAHWLTRGTWACGTAKPETIYDFGGFPDALYQVKYNAPGSPELASGIHSLAGAVQTTDEWGLDHGAWTIMKHIRPAADIPVFQLSIDVGMTMQAHFELGKALRKLREKGVVIVGSGNVVHNLQKAFENMGRKEPAPAYEWASGFDQFVKESILAEDHFSLVNYSKKDPGAANLSVPTTDHFIPLLYAAGLRLPGEHAQFTYEGMEYGALSMRCVQFG
ncbi:MAG: 4,5-DOPA dioxygenase extradiol [Bacteroidetes bacterium]|nr:4,5-DOPA dioxygenase extradiol [Bacteroidota bacterium]